VVWIESQHKANQWPNYALLVYDRLNTACVNIEQSHPSTQVKDGVEMYGFRLNAFTRWDQETILRVRPYCSRISQEPFVFTNPASSSFSDRTPKALPDSQTDGGLEMTLAKLVSGAPAPYNQGRNHRPTNDPSNQCVQLDFDFRQNGPSTTNGYPWLTSDAAGNYVRGLMHDYPSKGFHPACPVRMHPSSPPGTDGYFYQPGWWPDEPEWEVRLEFISRSRFSGDEIVTLTNIPVRPGSQQDADDEWAWDASNTNFTFLARGKANGVQMKLLPALPVPDPYKAGEKYLRVLIHSDTHFDPQGMKLTRLQATDDPGGDIWTPFGSPWTGHYSLEFPDVRDVKTLNVKLALHKSRFLEFTVKPAKQ
jgi:hypothetical protein